VELRQYFRIARKWWWLVVVSTLVAAAVSYKVSEMFPPVYRASTSLLVKVDSSTVFVGEQLAVTYKELLTKRPIIEATAQALGLDPRQIEEKIQVRLIYETSLIEVTAEATDPYLAMRIANGMVAAFMRISRESGSIQTRDLVVVEPAAQPLKPASPRKKLNTLLAATVGFSLATGVAFLVEYLDDTLETVEDIRQSLSLPTLTVVPCLNGRRRRRKAPIIADDPGSPLIEAYRTLRTRIQFSRVDGTSLTLLITSPLSREEKVKVVTNLSVVMAQTGLKVLLVDTDLRQPQLHEVFGLAQEPGLSTLLAAETRDCWEYVTETGIANLCLLTSGSLPPDPLGLLGSRRIVRLIGELKEQADVVVFNTPPILTVADAVVMASRVDGTILVIESQSTRQEAATRALEMLHNVGAKVLGVVLNGVRMRSSEYHHYSDFRKS
jgi:capsular exopolysaccharide synthesis family protein